MAEQKQQLLVSMQNLRRLGMQRFHQLLRKDGLSVAQSELLLVLMRAKAPMQPKLLAAEMHLTPGAISQLISSLEAANYVHRLHPEDDKRTNLIALSDMATQKIQQLHDMQASFADEIARILSPTELQQLSSILDKLTKHLETTTQTEANKKG